MRKLVLPALSLLLSLLTVGSLHAQGIWGSRAISHRFVVSGTRLYAAEGRGVGVYDLATATRLESATRDDETFDVATLGTGELVSLTAAGIDRWTIQPNGRLSLTTTLARRGLTHIAASPTIVAASTDSMVNLYSTANGQLNPAGAVMVDGVVNALAFHGDTLIIAIDGIEVEFVDSHNTASNSLLAEQAKDLFVSGNTLYLAAGGNGLVIIDLTGTPHVVGRTESGQANLTRVVASGTRVYGVENDHVVHIYETANPAAVIEAESLDEPATAIAASGFSVYTSGMRVDEFGLPLETGVPLRVFQASIDGSLHAVGQVTEPAGPVSGVAISPNGSLAYVVDRPYLRVLDISQSAAPKQIAALLMDNIQDHIRINGNGTRVVLYNRGDAQLVDVTNPYAPRFINVWHSLGRPPSRAGFLHDYVLEANWTTGFHVLDYDHYTPPAIIGAMKMDYHELVIKAGSDTAYISAQRVALAPVDLRDPVHPTNPTVKYLWMQEGAFADANDSHADLLLARTPEGVKVMTLADPLSPAEVSSIPMPDAVSITAAGQTLYIAASGHVVPVDLSDAEMPSLGTSTMRATAPQQMATAAGKLVIADTYAVRVVGPDTAPVPPSRPAHPRAVRP